LGAAMPAEDTVGECATEGEIAGGVRPRSASTAVKLLGDMTQETTIASPPFSLDDDPGDRRS
jgi:hypothetical protein